MENELNHFKILFFLKTRLFIICQISYPKVLNKAQRRYLATDEIDIF